MMRVTRSSALLAALVGVALAVPASAQLIPADWNVRHHYTLGDAEGGILGNPAAATAIDSVGGMDLPLTGTTSLYAAGLASTVAVDFNNLYGPYPTETTEHYSDPNADFNPIDPENWGVSFDVSVDTLPGLGDDGSTGLVHLGTGFTHGSPGLMLELYQGELVLHLPAVAFLQTGLFTNVGGTDHIEFANINGVMDLEVNGVPAGLDFDANAWCLMPETVTCPLDPDPGVTIGAVFTANTAPGGSVPYARGADAVIDEVKIYDGGEFPCDFDSDGRCNVNDINLMFMQGDLVVGVQDPDSSSPFNLNGDTVINNQDVDQWLREAATVNGFGSPYLRGDTDDLGNETRDVDVTDFNALASNYAPQGTPSGIFAQNWHLGNFDGDADVDITDFNSLAGNFLPDGYGAGQAGATPEPSAFLLMILGIAGGGWCVRVRR